MVSGGGATCDTSPALGFFAPSILLVPSTHVTPGVASGRTPVIAVSCVITPTYATDGSPTGARASAGVSKVTGIGSGPPVVVSAVATIVIGGGTSCDSPRGEKASSSSFG